jgi:hypothetical protein
VHDRSVRAGAAILLTVSLAGTRAFTRSHRDRKRLEALRRSAIYSP